MEKKNCWCGKPAQNHHIDYDDPRFRSTTILSAERKGLEKVFEGMDIKDLAFRLKTSPSVVYNIKYGLRRVSALRAIEIEKVTGGKISRALLRPDIFGN